MPEEQKQKKALGRPRKILDENKISQLVGKGFTIEFVANFFDVHVDTLYVNYSEALRKGYAFRNGCLQAKQFKEAMVRGNVTMLIWLGKQWLKQKDQTEQTNTNFHVIIGEDGSVQRKPIAADELLQPLPASSTLSQKPS